MIFEIDRLKISLRNFLRSEFAYGFSSHRGCKRGAPLAHSAHPSVCNGRVHIGGTQRFTAIVTTPSSADPSSIYSSDPCWIYSTDPYTVFIHAGYTVLIHAGYIVHAEYETDPCWIYSTQRSMLDIQYTTIHAGYTVDIDPCWIYSTQ